MHAVLSLDACAALPGWLLAACWFRGGRRRPEQQPLDTMPAADSRFAASPKLLTPSPLREPGGVAQFAAPPAPPATYCPAPTGALPLPSLLHLTRDDAAALPLTTLE